MPPHLDQTVRVAIVLDVADPNPDLLFIWAGIRAARLVAELWGKGIDADIVSVEIDGECHYKW